MPTRSCPLIGGRVWYDEHLFRDGAMSPLGIKELVNEWEDYGLEPYKIVEGKRHWQDCCVIEGMLGGVTLPCEWVEFIPNANAVFHKDSAAGKIITRQDFIEKSQIRN